MQPLSYSFIIFKYCGIWRTTKQSQGWRTQFYSLYSCLAIFIVYTFTISEFIDLTRSFDNVEDFANGSFMLLPMISACGKAANLFNKRDSIIELMNVLQNDICRPRSVEESRIQRECDKGVRFNTLWYGTLVGSAAVSIAVRSFILDIPQRILPFKAWLPYNYDRSQIGFWFAYFHQVLGCGAGACVNIAFDTLVPGLLMQTCAQIKILKLRFNTIPKTIDMIKKSCWTENNQDLQNDSQLIESELLSECVKHQLEIYQFSNTLNNAFGLVVSLQYSVSSIVICVSAYELSKVSLLTTAFAMSMLYLACMLAQIFNYCFYSSETTLQSMEICDAIYRMDWSSLNIRTQKSLITIMIRSLRPITFTCANIITLSLDSFSKLIKFSYSTYNVLQQSRE